MKHLHQPWETQILSENGENYIHIYDNRGVRFASVYCEQKEDSKIRANLFKNAPEMKQKLSSLYEELGSIRCSVIDESIPKESISQWIWDEINKIEEILNEIKK